MAFARALITRLNSGGMTSAIARDLRRYILASLTSLLLLSYEWLLCTGLGVSYSSIDATNLEDDTVGDYLHIVAILVIYNYTTAAVSAASLERNGTMLKLEVVRAIALLL